MRLMKGNQDGHNLTDRQRTSPLTLFLPTGKLLPVPDEEKHLAEIIDIAEQNE